MNDQSIKNAQELSKYQTKKPNQDVDEETQNNTSNSDLSKGKASKSLEKMIAAIENTTSYMNEELKIQNQKVNKEIPQRQKKIKVNQHMDTIEEESLQNQEGKENQTGNQTLEQNSSSLYIQLK